MNRKRRRTNWPDYVLVADVMLHAPKLRGPKTTAGELRALFRDEHVHAALIASGGKLVTVVEREDLDDACSRVSDEVSAVKLGRLLDRTVLDTAAICAVYDRMLASGQWRLAVVDDRDHLVGLLCLKRSRDGFCSDEDVAARTCATQPGPAGDPDGTPQPARVLPPTAGVDAGRRPNATDVVATLERWQLFGGSVHVISQLVPPVTISLGRCDGGEEQQRIVTADPDVIRWLIDHGVDGRL